MSSQVRLKRNVSMLALLMLASVSLSLAQRPAGRSGERVTDASTREPLVGANVLLIGTTLAPVRTSKESMPWMFRPGSMCLAQYRIVGYTKQERTILVGVGATNHPRIGTTPGHLQFDEVIVTGSGGLRRRKARLGNSISTLKTDDLEKVPRPKHHRRVRRPDHRRAGLNSSGVAGAGSLLQLRGANSLTGHHPAAHHRRRRALLADGLVQRCERRVVGRTGAASR